MDFFHSARLASEGEVFNWRCLGILCVNRESSNASEVDERQLTNNNADKVFAGPFGAFNKIDFKWKKKFQ